jgi:hypothetical protein
MRMVELGRYDDVSFSQVEKKRKRLRFDDDIRRGGRPVAKKTARHVDYKRLWRGME